MTLSLARDKLRYDEAQMGALARQIQMGDLTPVLQIYEEDIKSPLKSALGGTLLRSLFIQVQKAKVRFFISFVLLALDSAVRFGRSTSTKRFRGSTNCSNRRNSRLRSWVSRRRWRWCMASGAR